MSMAQRPRSCVPARTLVVVWMQPTTPYSGRGQRCADLADVSCPRLSSHPPIPKTLLSSSTTFVPPLNPVPTFNHPFLAFSGKGSLTLFCPDTLRRPTAPIQLKSRLIRQGKQPQIIFLAKSLQTSALAALGVRWVVNISRLSIWGSGTGNVNFDYNLGAV